MPIPFIPYSRQCIEEDDFQAVFSALKQDLITQGPVLKQFEEAVAEYCGARFAVAFSNGTTALHAACMAADIRPGQEGIVPPISFAATANCLEYVGAKPVFADVTGGLPLLDPEKIEAALTKKTRVILPVHFSGAVADMEAIGAIAKKRGLTVIEDACHALGSVHHRSDGGQTRVGACAHSQMTVFSFHPVKNITTGEGGMVTTNDEALFERLKTVRHHGITAHFPDKPAWYYEMRTLGFNFRLTDLQAALGVSQLKKSERFIAARQAHFEEYRKALAEVAGIRLLTPDAACRSALHLCVIQVEDAALRDPLFNYLRSQEIGCQLHYIPIYRHPYYRDKYGLNPEAFPASEDYFSRSLSIPLFPQMTAEDQKRVIRAVRDGLAAVRAK